MTKIIFKCEICRQVYVLRERPSNCPFCGSFEEHVKPVEDVPDIEEYELTNISYKNIKNAFKMELKANKFYARSVYNINIDNILHEFNVARMHEYWHSKILKEELEKHDMDIDDNIQRVSISDSNDENRRAAMIAEAQAIVDYKKYLEEATEPRVKMVFAALLEVEQMHLDLIS